MSDQFVATTVFNREILYIIIFLQIKRRYNYAKDRGRRILSCKIHIYTHHYSQIDIINTSANHKKYGSCRLGKEGSRPQNYICVEKDDAFQIFINTIDQRDKKTYGAVLFLDGQRVHGKKTFSCKTVFHGFKMGGGQFKEFIFSSPRFAGMQEEDSREEERTNSGFQSPFNRGERGGNERDDSFLDTKHTVKKGTLIIEFYETVQFERNNRPNQVHTKEYETHFIEDANKKSSFAESVRIKEGKTFTLPPKNIGGGPRRF